MSDSGHETVGQALLVTGVAAGALTAAELAGIALRGIDTLIAAMP